MYFVQDINWNCHFIQLKSIIYYISWLFVKKFEKTAGLQKEILVEHYREKESDS